MGQITHLGVTEPEFNSNLLYSIALLTTPLHCRHHPSCAPWRKAQTQRPPFGPGLAHPETSVRGDHAALAQDSGFLKSKGVGLGREDAGTAGRKVET